MRHPVLGAVSLACRRRLVGHYGRAVKPWLAAVPRVLGEAADRWRLRIVGYHDAGCASVLALARTPDGTEVLLKAWYDRARYAHEVAALRGWPRGIVPGVLASADDLAVATLELVGGRPGGATRPPGEYEAVALALAWLHDAGAAREGFPRLDDHLASVVVPRIDRRLRAVGGDLPERCVAATAQLDPYARKAVLLHADLYRENVPFGVNGRPVFVDPLPTVGDPVFDWAFWVVYYDLLRDPVLRLRLGAAVAGIPIADLVPWCLALCVDGLLYYREVNDPRAQRMVDVMTALAGYDREAVVC